MGVKSQVAQHWHPEEAYRRHNPAGTRSSPRINRSTELRVELTSDGGLRTLKLLGSCGLGFLDDEALSAVREAAPFAHPPRGLIDGDGLMRFKFGLLFDPSGGPSQMWWSRIRDDRTSVDAGAAD